MWPLPCIHFETDPFLFVEAACHSRVQIAALAAIPTSNRLAQLTIIVLLSTRGCAGIIVRGSLKTAACDLCCPLGVVTPLLD